MTANPLQARAQYVSQVPLEAQQQPQCCYACSVCYGVPANPLAARCCSQVNNAGIFGVRESKIQDPLQGEQLQPRQLLPVREARPSDEDSLCLPLPAGLLCAAV